AEMCVAVCGHDFENAIVQLEDGDIERSATEIVNSHYSVLTLIEAIGERSSRRLIHQAKDFKSSDAARVLCGLPLCIVEICGDCDDRFGNRSVEESLRVALELAQNES